MARTANNVTPIEEKKEEVKPVIIRNSKNNDIYVLEFNRFTVEFAEQRGFDVNELLSGKIMTYRLRELFFYAFRMHHPKITKAETDKLIDEMGGLPDAMIERLLELYMVTASSIIQTEDSAKNSTLTIEL